MINVRYKEINHLFESIELMSDTFYVPMELSENWIADAYKENRAKTALAVEKYTLSLLAEKVKNSQMDIDKINQSIDNRLRDLLNNPSSYKGTVPVTIQELNNIKVERNLDEGKVDLYLQYISNSSNLLYFKSLINGTTNNPLNKEELYKSKNKEAAVILATLSEFVNTTKPGDDRLRHLDQNVSRLLYLFKDFDVDNSDIIIPVTRPNLDREMISNLTISGIDELLGSLENILNSGSEYLLDFVIEELYSLSSKIQIVQRGASIVRECAEIDSGFGQDKYLVLDERFTELTESIFFNDEEDEIDVEKLAELYQIAYELSEYELVNEASSRIITKGTDKAVRKIGNKSAKSNGMGKSDSKMDQIKRGARVIDDRASDAINRKIDQVINISKDAKREKLITGKNTVKLGKAVKTTLAIITSGAAAKIALGPLVGGAISIITALGTFALSKRTEDREKKRILLELETELKITKEKIEDAKGDNAREQKYQLMRIQTSLEKEITRIKHGLRYY